MLKGSLAVIGVLFLVPAFAQAQGNTTAAARIIETSCTGYCHGPSLIAQQRLDLGAWTREVDKMIRWGANVPGDSKDAVIGYLAGTFNNARSRPNTSRVVPEGKGMEIFRASCLSCHNDQPIGTLKLDRAGWTRQVERMIAWGAYVPITRKDELVDYLLTNFSK